MTAASTPLGDELFADWLDREGIGHLDVTFFSPESFYRKPQIGSLTRMSWANLQGYLARPFSADSKSAVGGYSPALYTDDVRRKTHLVHACLLVVDIDHGGDVDRIADELQAYAAIVHETFSSTDDAPRCRVLLRPDTFLSVEAYDRLHRIIREQLRAKLGVDPDDGAKDATRVSYLPVRRPGDGYRYRVTHGAALPVARILAARAPEPPRSRPRVVAPAHVDRYKRGALRRAAEALASAREGQRHETLNREAYALARLDLSEDEIAAVLLPVALSTMGERRRREAERTIADAVRARKGAA